MLFGSRKILQPVASLVVLSLLATGARAADGSGVSSAPVSQPQTDGVSNQSNLEARLTAKIAEKKNLIADIDRIQEQLASVKNDSSEYAVEVGATFALFIMGGWSTGGFNSQNSRFFRFGSDEAVNIPKPQVTADEIKTFRSEFDKVLLDHPDGKKIAIVLKDENEAFKYYFFSNRRELSEYAFDMMTRYGKAPRSVDEILQAPKGSRLYSVLEGLGITYVDQQTEGLVNLKIRKILSESSKLKSLQNERSIFKFKGETHNKIAFSILVVSTLIVGVDGLVRGVQLALSGADAVRLSTLVLPNMRRQLIEVQDDLLQARRDLKTLESRGSK